MDEANQLNVKRKSVDEPDSNDNNNGRTRTMKKPRDNNNSCKHAFNICGMNFVIGRSKPANSEYLHAFVSRMVRANNLESHIIKISNNVQKMHDIDICNIDFTQTVDFVASFFQNYQDIPSPTPSYKFKVPKNGEDKTMFSKHWNEHFIELRNFKNAFGHCNVSRTTKGWDQLGNWLADQRRKLRQGKLTEQQYQKLTDLGNVEMLRSSDLQGVEWDRSYQYAPKYSIEN